MTSFENVQFMNSYTEDNFVVLKYKKDTINIYLPLGYEINRTSENNEISSIELKTRILLLLKSISLVKFYDKSNRKKHTIYRRDS